MKKIYNIKSDRYGYTHRFEQIENDMYKFISQDEWMHLRLIFEDNEMTKVKFVDADGGPFMSKNWTNGEIEIEDISFDNKKLIFKIKEI